MRELGREAVRKAPNGPVAGAYVTRCDATHPLRAVVGYVTGDPSRPDWYVSTTLHLHEGRELHVVR